MYSINEYNHVAHKTFICYNPCDILSSKMPLHSNYFRLSIENLAKISLAQPLIDRRKNKLRKITNTRYVKNYRY